MLERNASNDECLRRATARRRNMIRVALVDVRVSPSPVARYPHLGALPLRNSTFNIRHSIFNASEPQLKNPQPISTQTSYLCTQRNAMATFCIISILFPPFYSSNQFLDLKSQCC